MKLDKAIETLTSIKKVCEGLFPPLEQDAVSLGIEALKWRKLIETDYGSWCGPLLPGEDPPDPKAIPIETLVKIRESPLGRK